MTKPKKGVHHQVRRYQPDHTDRTLLFILGLFGFILFWRGVSNMMDSVPLLNNPIFLVVLGLIIMYTSGLIIAHKPRR